MHCLIKELRLQIPHDTSKSYLVPQKHDLDEGIY